jgi:intracellular sulfur oxidation DsrE/DsrF family protein
MSIVQRLIAAVLLAGASLTAFAQDVVVYHIDEASVQALRAVRSIRNHLDTDAKARITVVSHADGVDFLMTGAKDRNGNEYASLVSALVSRGVRFEVCELTLQQRGLKKDQFILEAEFTPSGVVRIAKLQQQGAAYIKP